LRRLYGRHYFEGEEYRDYRAERPILEKHFRRRLKRLLQFVPNANKRHLIEIGCAYGFFLGVARYDFATVQGFDISAEAVNYARQQMGVSATTRDFLDYAPRDPVDVVCMWDTIEHLQHPHVYVEKLAQIMPRGGVVAVTTGDIESLVARLRGSRWRQIHPYAFTLLFSENTRGIVEAEWLSNQVFRI
jgi:2-polyprenyl-3-methyl-5-hydroxy-6-metoxy-1,4-benzoquinol methylase